MDEKTWYKIQGMIYAVMCVILICVGILGIIYLAELQDLKGSCMDLIEPDILCPIMCGNRSYNLTEGPIEVLAPTLPIDFMHTNEGEIWDYSSCQKKRRSGLTAEEWVKCSRWFQPL